MVAIKEWYRRVNSEWPQEVPALSFPEAQRAARRLYRWALVRTYSGRVIETAGNRYTWMRRGDLFVNDEQGWKRMVHDLSHLFWEKANWGEGVRPHERGHARFDIWRHRPPGLLRLPAGFYGIPNRWQSILQRGVVWRWGWHPLPDGMC